MRASYSEYRRAVSEQLSADIERFVANGGEIQVMASGEGAKDPTKADQHVLNRAQREFIKRPAVPNEISIRGVGR